MTNPLVNSGSTPTEVALNRYSFEAKTALVAVKDSAIKAAACCYMVLLGCKEEEGLKWLKAQINAFNARSDKHNAPIEVRKNEAATFKNTGTVEGHFAFETATSPEHGKEIAAALKELEADAEQPDAYWSAQQQTVLPHDIKVVDGKQIGVVVRVVLDLREKKQAALASRYTRVVKWLDKEFGKVTPTYEEVAQKLIDIGGYEAAVRQAIPDEDHVVFYKGERAAIAEANAKLVTAAAKSVTPMATLTLSPQHVHEGNVILLGRTLESGGVAVVGEVALKPSEVLRAVARFDDPVATPADPTAEFLSRVLDLGRVVEEEIEVSVGKSGGKVVTAKAERKVTLRCDADGKPQLVVSPRHDDVGMVIYATPMVDTIQLGAVDGPLLLKRSYRECLRQLVEDRIHRRFLSVVATTAPIRKGGDAATSKLGWLVKNAALAGVKDSKNAETWVYWSEPKETAQMPLDVLSMADLGRIRIRKADIVTAYTDWVKELKKADEKTPFAVRLLFDTSTLTLRERDPSLDHVIPVTGALKRGLNLPFSPKDIYTVFKALVSQRADIFEVQPDDLGGMSITWMDDLAQYRLFVPTCRKDLSRTDRLLAPMRAVMAASVSQKCETDASCEKIVSMDTLMGMVQSEAPDDPCAL